MRVKTYIPKKVLQETLVGTIERNYIIKPIDQWERGDS